MLDVRGETIVFHADAQILSRRPIYLTKNIFKCAGGVLKRCRAGSESPPAPTGELFVR